MASPAGSDKDATVNRKKTAKFEIFSQPKNDKPGAGPGLSLVLKRVRQRL
jgi:hypothetical protein